MSERVKVAYVNQPKPGKKQGSIKTDDNRLFGVWPNHLSQFTVGQTYDIEVESYARRDGTQGYTVKSLTPVNGSNGASNGSGETYNVSRWQTCLQVAGRIFQGKAEVTTDEVIAFAQALYEAAPAEVEVTEEEPF